MAACIADPNQPATSSCRHPSRHFCLAIFSREELRLLNRHLFGFVTGLSELGA